MFTEVCVEIGRLRPHTEFLVDLKTIGLTELGENQAKESPRSGGGFPPNSWSLEASTRICKDR